jgi:hypothetical protein
MPVIYIDILSWFLYNNPIKSNIKGKLSMAKSPVMHTLIVPPTYVAAIIGVNAIRVGPRKVWAILQSGAEISVKRKAVESDLGSDFMVLANKVMTRYQVDKQAA